MSTFTGRFRCLPGISADRFDGPNRRSSVFFLSHCHTDHMVGLDHADGVPGPLYLSRVSALIVKHLFPVERVWARCVVLEIGQPTLISYTTDGSVEPNRVTVTAIPAGHCPGSVMFVFELDARRILYTGDFRLSLKHISRLKPFQTASRLDVAHIDSTFFSTNYKHFPTQRESAQVVARLCTDWLAESPSNQVALQLSARYGYEYLFQHLHHTLGLAIHVNDTEADTWRYVPEMDGCFSPSNRSGRIHACFASELARSARSSRTIPCDPSIDEALVRVIKPSAMVWTGWQPGDEICRSDGRQFFRVCYSNHSSWTEVRDLLCFLRPREVQLNVLPAAGTGRSVMWAELQSVLAEFQTKEEVAEKEDEEEESKSVCNLADMELKGNASAVGRRIDVTAEDSDEEPVGASSRVLVKRRRKEN